MKHFIVGLGNPDEEHTENRHNAGRTLVLKFAKKQGFPQWEKKKKAGALFSEGVLGKEEVELVLPETYMNKSGTAVAHFVKNKKQAERLVVAYDDIDLPLGVIRIAFGRGSGGHKGIESVIRSIGTKDFVRLRIGVAPTTPSGKIKKPQGEDRVLDYLLGNFNEKDKEKLRVVFKKGSEALHTIMSEGRMEAMNQYN
ncbi:MAG: aminoacyl-tRNA hydrolase [Candidatus Paceibacterota bacterium]